MYNDLVKRLIRAKEVSGKTWQEMADESGLSFSLIIKLAYGHRKNPTVKSYLLLDSYLKKLEKDEAA